MIKVTRRVANILRAFLQSWGTSSTKRNLWDKEFAGGRWDYIEETADDCLYPILAKYANGGSILDLGCGSGNTGNELDPASYSKYVGVDISAVALQKAEARSALSGRSGINTYLQGDVYSHIPIGSYDVILFRESIFYVPKSKILPMLERYRNSLSLTGVFIVRMCDREKYRRILELIRAHFSVIETHLPTDISTVVIVFR